MSAFDQLTPEELAFIQPNDEALDAACWRTDEFLAETRRVHPLRWLHNLVYTTQPCDLEPCLRGVSREEAAELELAGFTFLHGRATHAKGGSRYTEQWLGPDGAIVLESTDAGRNTMWLVFENGHKLSLLPFGAVSQELAWLQPEHEHLVASGSLLEDYVRLVRRAVEVTREQTTRPLRMRDDDQFRDVLRFHDEQVLSLRHAAVATSPFWLMAGGFALLMTIPLFG